MTTQPLVTIAIPTYNRADSYLRQALESALDQTYRGLDILVADNCSTDATEALVRRIAGSRVRYFKHPINIGAVANTKFCIEQAQGVYLLLLHDDDLIDNDFIETCLRAANYRTDAGLIRTGMRWIDNDGKVIGQALNLVGRLSDEDFFLGWFNNQTPMHPCSTLFNTRRLREIGGFRSKHNLFDDVITEVQIAVKYGRVDVPDIKASYRHHGNRNTSSAKISDWCEESSILLNLMYTLVPQSKSDRVRKAGTKFLIAHNYRIASGVNPLSRRLMAYAIVLKHFNYPLFTFLSLAISHRARALKLLLRRVLVYVGVNPKIASFRKRLWRLPG